MVVRYLALVMLFVVSCAERGFAESEPLLGSWEYLQANPARKSGFDKEGERIFVKRSPRGECQVEYFGLERMGEEGLYYSAEVAEQVECQEDFISFILPKRELYHKRPASLKAASRMASAGVTKVGLRFQGSIQNGELILQCQTEQKDARMREGDECPDRTLRFHRVRDSSKTRGRHGRSTEKVPPSRP